METPPIKQKTNEEIASQVRSFSVESKKPKNGKGVHMFKFKRVGAAARDDTDDNVIYVGSEVTDDNNVLDVIYQQWCKKPTPAGKEEWKPIYTFSSGRVALIAVATLLRRGYAMKQIQ